MPLYKYKAAALDGSTSGGRREAADERTLENELRAEKLFLISCTAIDKKKASKQLTSSELIDFFRQTGSMLSAGLTLTAALSIFLKEEMSENMRRAAESVYKSIKLGAAFSEAMTYANGAFPQSACRLIDAAEDNGTVSSACLRLAEFYEKDEESREIFKSHSSYPMAIVILLLLLLGVIVFVVPMFGVMYGGEKLPVITAFLYDIYLFLRDKWIYALLVIAAIAAVIRLTAAVPAVRLYFSEKLLKRKKNGRLFRTVYTARFCRTFAFLYSGGLPVISAIAAAKKDIGNTYLEAQTDAAIKDIRSGSSVFAAFERADGFDGKLRSAVIAGEESGRLGDMLNAAADALEHEAERSVKKLYELTERLVWSIAAVIVLLIAASLILPVYELYLNI